MIIRGKSKEMQKRYNMKFKVSENCIYMKKYLEVLKNLSIVQYIHPGSKEPLFLSVYIG